MELSQVVSAGGQDSDSGVWKSGIVECHTITRTSLLVRRPDITTDESSSLDVLYGLIFVVKNSSLLPSHSEAQLPEARSSLPGRNVCLDL